MWTVSAIQEHPKALLVCDEEATMELKVKNRPQILLGGVKTCVAPLFDSFFFPPRPVSCNANGPRGSAYTRATSCARLTSALLNLFAFAAPRQVKTVRYFKALTVTTNRMDKEKAAKKRGADGDAAAAEAAPLLAPGGGKKAKA